MDNYFFSDDFHWLGRAILMQNSSDELFTIEGRDFNPVYLILLWILIKIFGLSPVVFRVVGIVTFSAVAWMFFYILTRYFKINPIIAFSTALLLNFNVFVSEVVLNLAALVYSLSLLFFLGALTFYFDRKRLLFLIFLLAGFLTKETIILAVIPLVFYEKEKNNRLFIIGTLCSLGLLRVLLQLVAAGTTGSYTGFYSFSHMFYKLYFIILRSMNISPLTLPLVVGIIVIIFVFFISLYYMKKKRGLLFFLLFLVVFALFFSLLPKLSSRYFLYPSFGFWGIVALLTHHFYKNYPKQKNLKYVLAPLVLVSLLFNSPFIQKEIEDYKILGTFSHRYIQQQAVLIKNQINPNADTEFHEMTLSKEDNQPLKAVYQQIINRDNLPKLLPFRPNSIGGVIEPRHLVPIIFYPGKIARWRTSKETHSYFIGRIAL
ncbi:MAG: hypothetical protein GTO45_30725 [Candidatus Aminicenantes bacterium]|nr:hypothetical protein [Candidatus Aminicenantes bacterium]NIM83167.1 hypothetical protein [Candidatus Aminicenantes bacterium]NIN22543.1 hypothetical protein [Candidatus Aminicenantes bacterium]NIN46314.1 hypothetical protein [Candidatus Aminicenantes bacterium]NIN89153.1 hypothetical protein [Candidatus Aminicenantes bacterium]